MSSVPAQARTAVSNKRLWTLPHRVYEIILGFEKQNFLTYYFDLSQDLVSGFGDGPMVMI